MFLGWYYLTGICCASNRELAVKHCLKAAEGNMAYQAFVEMLGLDKLELAHNSKKE